MSYQCPSTPRQPNLSQDLLTTTEPLANVTNDQHIPEFTLPEPAVVPQSHLSPPAHLQQPDGADTTSSPTIGLGISYTPPNSSARPPPYPYTDLTTAHQALLRALVAQQRLLQPRDADPRACQIVTLRQVVRERERALERAREACEASLVRGDGLDGTFSWARGTEPRGMRCVDVLAVVVRERERALERAREALEVMVGRWG